MKKMQFMAINKLYIYKSIKYGAKIRDGVSNVTTRKNEASTQVQQTYVETTS